MLKIGKVLVLVLLFGLGSLFFQSPVPAKAQESLVNPSSADAQLNLGNRIKAIYNIYCGVREAVAGQGECETHRQAYIGSLFNDLILDNIALAIWDKTTGDIFTDANSGGEPPVNTVALLGRDPEYAQLQMDALRYGRSSGGFSHMLVGTYAYLQESPPIPTDFALFLQDSSKDTIFGTSAYAANPLDTTYQSIVLGAWRISRNIALSLVGVVLAVAALMVIFRVKLAPQVTVSIYNILPTLPVSIALIVLSYPIISLVLANIPSAMFVAFQLGMSIVGMVLRENILSIIGADFSNGFPVMVAEASNVPFRIFQILPSLGVGALFILMAFALTITIGLFFFIWNIAKIFASYIMTTILAPFVLVMSILPGKQGLIVNLGKRVLVDFLSLPVMILGLFVAMAILIYVPAPLNTDLVDILNGNITIWDAVNPFMVLLAAQLAMLVKGFIALGMLFGLRKVRPSLERAIGVSSMFGFDDEKKR